MFRILKKSSSSASGGSKPGLSRNRCGKSAVRLVLVGAIVAASISPGYGKVFRWAFQGDAQTMDPHGLAETMTLSFQGNMYEGLVRRDAKMKIVGALAERWLQVSPTVWRFHLRRGVRFHDGSAFAADDVKFSLERAASEGSGMRGAAFAIGRTRIVDSHTVDIETDQPNPILPMQLELIYIMDKQWAEANNTTTVSAPGDAKAANFAHFNANGTGPFILVEREAGTRSVLKRNAAYWGEVRGNISEAVFTPVANAATRVAALISGNVDLAYPVPVQDWERLARTAGVRPLTGAEARTIFLGFDQTRMELKGSDLKGRNPFKDVRVRRAVAHAIDIAAIRDKVMRGAAVPAGLMVAPEVNGFAASLNGATAPDLAAARRLMAEAGLAAGFSVIMDCPNNRYMNDEKICQAVASMLARINIRVRLNAMPKAKFFAKILSHNGYDTSLYLLGWTPSTFDSHNPIAAVMSCRGRGDKLGMFNIGGYCNPRINALAKLIQAAAPGDERRALIQEAFRIHKRDVGHLPLHQQRLSWGVADGIAVVQRPDNFLTLRDVLID